jgi:O-antigen ligase
MFRASPAYGWGAGSFRFIFPIYQSHYPAIYSDPTEWLYWEHAHDDYAEFLAEFGIVGTTLLALGGICYLARLARLRFWRDPLSLLLFAGCCVTLLHCLGDFNFYNPAILITWCAFWPALVRWNEIASPASSHST